MLGERDGAGKVSRREDDGEVEEALERAAALLRKIPPGEIVKAIRETRGEIGV